MVVLAKSESKCAHCNAYQTVESSLYVLSILQSVMVRLAISFKAVLEVNTSRLRNDTVTGALAYLSQNEEEQ